MSSNVPPEIHSQIFDQFWSQLTWQKLQKRIEEALCYSDQVVPLETICPAVTDLASQVISGLIGSAIKRPGEVVSPQEVFTFDQRVVILRIIEAIIYEYEKFKNARLNEAMIPSLSLRSSLSNLPHK